jgi:hypothetical protein
LRVRECERKNIKKLIAIHLAKKCILLTLELIC